jgi:two-component system cell cycle sensor histidine kinase/response regulator CckA
MRLRQSAGGAEDLRHFWELSRDLFSIIEFDGRYRRVNGAVTRLLGYTEEELCELSVLDFVHPDDAETARALLEQLTRGEPAAGEARVVGKDGSARWLELSAIAHPSEQLIYAAARDVTRRKQAEEALKASEAAHTATEEALRASEAKYRNLVERLPLVIYMDNLDEVSSNIYTSPQTEWLLGYSADEWANHPELFVEVIHPDDRERVVEEMTRERPEPYRVEYRVIARDGRTVWVRDESFVIRDDDGTPLYGQGYLLNITAEKEAEEDARRLEEALRQAQKMEAVGRLAGGIAHDFNNLLTAIVGHVELGRMSAENADPDLQVSLEQIGRAADRAANLTRQLLAFGRRQMLAPRVLDLNEVVASVEDMFRSLIGEHIALHVKLAARVRAVKADRGQLEQVLANLAVNARDAMPDGGTLVIETTNVDLDEASAQPFELGAGRYASLMVSDTGLGMDETVVARLFEPFFTTKEQGKGSGLGLATVYGIVRQSGGGVTATSRLGEGTTFTILLPETHEPADEPGHALAVDSLRGAERVVVVEDEPAVRQLVCAALEQQGYEVLSAPAPLEALERFSASDRPIDLLVTDVVMPGMGGRELAEKLSAVHPSMQVLYTTGYTDDPGIRLHAGGRLLEKPFRPGDLVRKVRELLDTASG